MNGRLNEWLVCRYIGRQSVERRAEDDLFCSGLFRLFACLVSRESQRLDASRCAGVVDADPGRCWPKPWQTASPWPGLPCARRAKNGREKGQKGTERGGGIGSCRVVSSEAPRAVLFLFFSSRRLSQLLHEVTEAASKAQAVELRAAYSRPNADL